MAVLLLLLLSAFLACCCCWFFLVARKWCKLRQIEVALRGQGLKGPSRSPLLGGIMPDVIRMRNSFKQVAMQDKRSQDIVGRLAPEFVIFSKLYGVPYFFWWLYEPKVVVNNPEHARELLSKQAIFTGKSEAQRRRLINLLGNGLVSVEGEEWAHHRRVISPAFHLEKLKGMTGTFEKCTRKMLDNWQQMQDQQLEIDVQSQFSMLTADIISHTAFGSSYEKGQRVFQILAQLSKLFTKALPYEWIPLIRWLPIPRNLAIWRLHKEVDKLLLNLILERKDSVKNGRASTFGDDLLGLMLAESERNEALDNPSLVGECKTFYFAGHSTTAALLRWVTYLLAVHPEWQARAREEVLAACNSDDSWNADVLSKLKLVGMILHETLRLYPPASLMSRSCNQDIQLGDLRVPKGASVDIPVVAIHHDKELWGEDAHEFNPERFRNGVSRASKHPNAFMAFSFGPRICIGQSFALLEAKLVMAMLIKRFAFSLSPSYQHCPVLMLGIQPMHGIPIVLQPIKQENVTKD